MISTRLCLYLHSLDRIGRTLASGIPYIVHTMGPATSLSAGESPCRALSPSSERTKTRSSARSSCLPPPSSASWSSPSRTPTSHSQSTSLVRTTPPVPRATRLTISSTPANSMHDEGLSSGDSPVFQDADSELGDDGHSSTGAVEVEEVEEGDRTAQFEAPHDAPPSATKATGDNFGDLLKYTLATSALLTNKLAAALPLYPALDDTRTPQKEPTATLDDKAERVNEVVTARKALEWGEEWDVRGHEWRDRSAGLNCWLVLCWVVLELYTHLRPLAPLPPAIPASSTLNTPIRDEGSTETLHKSVVQAMEEFVKTAQELDIRVARALRAIREIEVISFGLGL